MKRFVKAVLEPFAKVYRAFFDPRFAQVGTRLDQIAVSNDFTRDEVRAAIDATAEALTLLNRNTRDIAIGFDEVTRPEGRLDQFDTSLDEHKAKLGEFAQMIESLERHLTSVPQSLEELAARDAVLLNRGESYEPFAGDKGLWFNPPITLRYSAGDVALRDVNERIVEVPFVFEKIAALETGSRILDVGCAESTVSFSLASLGYEVTGIDLHRYPLSHPSLTTVATALEDWDCEEAYFDGIVCLSAIEHFGLGAYGEAEVNDLDVLAMARISGWAKPGAVMVLTVPFGRYRVTELQRIYDMPRLSRLLDGWTIKDIRTALRLEDGAGWAVVQGEREFAGDMEGRHPAVVLVAATRDG